jgi:hypothetical protein
MPEALFCMWLKPAGFIVTSGQRPRNPHLGAGPEVPAYRVRFNNRQSDRLAKSTPSALSSAEPPKSFEKYFAFRLAFRLSFSAVKVSIGIQAVKCMRSQVMKIFNMGAIGGYPWRSERAH